MVAPYIICYFSHCYFWYFLKLEKRSISWKMTKSYIGLMAVLIRSYLSQDAMALRVQMTGGSAEEQKLTAQIYPLVSKHYLLLVRNPFFINRSFILFCFDSLAN